MAARILPFDRHPAESILYREGESGAEIVPRVGLRRERGFDLDGDAVSVRTVSGLSGARATMVALALETVLAVGVCGALLVWRWLS
jgi:hypothetical protein